MVSGLPNKYTQDAMLDEIQSRDLPVDFFYMPLFPKATRNVGYCFVNLSTVDGARRFCEVFDGLHLTKTHNAKACIVSCARVQGKEANIAAYQESIAGNSRVRPVLFENGVSVAFPVREDNEMLNLDALL